MPGTIRTQDARLEPRALIAAKAAIRGGVRFEPRCPETVHIRAGQPLQVRLLYRLSQPPRQEEHYRLSLRSTLGASVAAPARLEKGDRIGLPDELWGYIEQEYVLEEPGEYPLSLAATAHYRAPGHPDEEDAYEATVRVIVE